MALPGREFYLNHDAKLNKIRDTYVKTCSPSPRTEQRIRSEAATDAQVVLIMETELANSAMEIVLPGAIPRTNKGRCSRPGAPLPSIKSTTLLLGRFTPTSKAFPTVYNYCLLG